ncbi:MAG: bacillithiol biosynthesis cysteine-adding enzyme BshC [Pyrinomonadaceae bacterium]
MIKEIEREYRPVNARIKVSQIPFSDIPHQSKLFLNYQSDRLSLPQFYPNAVESMRGLSSCVPTVLENYETDREKLCDSLARLNLRFGAGDKTLQNLDLLRDPGTVAVMTGQQAGLFTGPLYTIYKALSAVKAAEDLSTSGVQAVPVFWVASEDHDFKEVSETWFTGDDAKVFSTSFAPRSYVDGSSVGSVEIDDGINETIERAFDLLPQTEFSETAKEVLSSCWSGGQLFGAAFSRTICKLLNDYGLILIDPMDGDIKQLAAPIYERAITHADAIVGGIQKKNELLEKAGFHKQVRVEDDYFPLFWHDDGGKRTALRKIGPGVYWAKERRRKFSVAELQDLVRREPDRLSPGVMLRPVVQDYLLPTVCYFGGAAEIAYFAQNSAVYETLSRPVTPILYRQSITVIEAKHRRLLEKLGLDFLDIFADREQAMLNIAERNGGFETAKLFAEVEEKVNTELNRLDQNLSLVDSTIAESLARRRSSIIYHIATLREKALLAQIRRDRTLARQIDDLWVSLLPNGQLQERSLNVFNYVNKFGPSFIEWVYQAIVADAKGHSVVEL